MAAAISEAAEVEGELGKAAKKQNGFEGEVNAV